MPRRRLVDSLPQPNVARTKRNRAVDGCTGRAANISQARLQAEIRSDTHRRGEVLRRQIRLRLIPNTIASLRLRVVQQELRYDRDVMEPSTIVLCSSLACVPLVRSLRERLVGTCGPGTNKKGKQGGNRKPELDPAPRRASASHSSRAGVLTGTDRVPVRLVSFVVGLRPRWGADRSFDWPFRG